MKNVTVSVLCIMFLNAHSGRKISTKQATLWSREVLTEMGEDPDEEFTIRAHTYTVDERDFEAALQASRARKQRGND